ncbi:hypothetical protein QYF36_007111 [Acer negundo]|nr:hypothetical protein QYF36_007111 [Acer negundo]
MTLLEKERFIHPLQEGLKMTGLQRLASSLVGKFKCVENRSKVMAGGPWIFDGALIMLEELSGKWDIDNMRFNYTKF